MQQAVLFKRLLNIFKFFAVIFFIFLVFILFNFIDTLFRVKTIVINNKKYKSAIFGINEIKNKNILFLTEDQIINIIKNQNPAIKKVKINKLYPSTLILTFEVESNFANFSTNSGYFILNNKGKILKKTKIYDNKLPLITYFQKIDHSLFQPGNSIDYSDLLLALYFIENVQKLGRTVNTVDINSLYMIRFKIEDKIILFSTEREREMQIYELSSILKRYRLEGEKYNTIDLRFYKPILKFSD